LFLWIQKRSGGCRGEAGESKEKREKPLSIESAPSNLGHTIEDLTAKKIRGDVDGGSLEEPYGYSRGEFSLYLLLSLSSPPPRSSLPYF